MENLDLQEIRGQLDEIDTRLVELFEKRMELCGQVNGKGCIRRTAGKAEAGRSGSHGPQ